MRIPVVAAILLALNAPVASADQLDDFLSNEVRIGNERDDYLAPDRPRYVAPDYAYGVPRGMFFRGASRLSVGEELLQMDFPLLWDMARAAAVDFDRWLRTIPAGEYWRKHFETPALLELLAANQSAPPAAADHQEILRILGNFERAAANSDMNDLTTRSSAHALQAALRELATPPEQRRLRQLSLDARRLNRTLDTFSTGVTWQRYLALPDEIVAAADRPPGDDDSRPEIDLQELDRIVARYDHVSQSPEYESIADLPEFQATHQRLIDFVNPPPQEPPPRPSPAVAEELPRPEPQRR